MNDLADEDDAAVWELAPSLVGVLDSALHPVAEPEFTGEPDRHVPGCERVVIRLHPVDEGTLIGGKVFLDIGFEAEPLPEVGG